LRREPDESMNSHPIVGGLRRVQFPMKSKTITNLQCVPRTDTGVPRVKSLRCMELRIVRELGKLEA